MSIIIINKAKTKSAKSSKFNDVNANVGLDNFQATIAKYMYVIALTVVRSD